MINGVARTITKVTMEFGDVVSAAFHYIENGIEKSIQFVMDTVEHIAKAVYAVMAQIAKFVGDVISAIILFIKLIFNFVDILALTRSTKHYLNQQINALPGQCQAGSESLKAFVSGSQMPSNDDVNTIANQISQGSSPKPSSVSGNSSVHNYAYNKFHSDLDKQTADGGSEDDIQSRGGNASLSEIDSNLGDSNDVINAMMSIVEKGFSMSSLGQLLSTGELLLNDTLNTLDDIVDDAVSEAEGTVATLSSSLQTEVPLIGWLLKLFGIDFTMEDVLCFVIAFGAHTVYAIEHGKSLRSIHDGYVSPETLSTLSIQSDSSGVAETVMRCFCYFFMSVELVLRVILHKGGKTPFKIAYFENLIGGMCLTSIGMYAYRVAVFSTAKFPLPSFFATMIAIDGLLTLFRAYAILSKKSSGPTMDIVCYMTAGVYIALLAVAIPYFSQAKDKDAVTRLLTCMGYAIINQLMLIIVKKTGGNTIDSKLLIAFNVASYATAASVITMPSIVS